MHTIALVDDSLISLFADIPCCDVAHAQDVPSRSSCRYPKTLLIHDNACFSIVHARFIIRHDYSYRPPNHASLRVLRRLEKHGDSLVPWHKPDLARSGMRVAGKADEKRFGDSGMETRDSTKMGDRDKKQIAHKPNQPTVNNSAVKIKEAETGEDEWVVVDGYQAKKGYYAEYFDYDKSWI